MAGRKIGDVVQRMPWDLKDIEGAAMQGQLIAFDQGVVNGRNAIAFWAVPGHWVQIQESADTACVVGVVVSN